MQFRWDQLVRLFFPHLVLALAAGGAFLLLLMLLIDCEDLWVRLLMILFLLLKVPCGGGVAEVRMERRLRRRLPVVELEVCVRLVMRLEWMWTNLLRASDVHAALRRLESRQHFGKASAVPCNPLRVLTVRHLLVWTEVCLQPL